jgi:hypothetical protein
MAIIGVNLVIHYQKYNFIIHLLKDKINRFKTSSSGYLEKINIITHENTVTVEYYTRLKTVGDTEKIQQQLTELNSHYQLKIQIIQGLVVLIVHNVVVKEDIEKITKIIGENPQ